MEQNTGIKARIISQHHTIYVAECGGRTLEARVCGRMSHEARTETDYPVVGDWVTLDRADDADGGAVILSLLPRKSLLTRTEPGSRQHSQAIAANLDYLLICMSCNRDYNIARMERYLAAALGARIEPVVVLTKSDLTDDAEGFAEKLREAHGGVRVIVCSAGTHTGVDPVRELLRDGVTVAFVGSSGVGKSTLINELLGEEYMLTSAIREDDARGRHTTTHRQLITMPGGCAIIDTPGMRSLSLDDSDVGDVFSDVEALVAACRFGNCSHNGEPGCAIGAALASGELDAKRWWSYAKLKQEEERRRTRAKKTHRPGSKN